MISNKNNAKFITLEGIDGAGKSTHLNWLAERLRSHGKNVLVTREPGGTPLGEALRELLLHQAMHLETEALLMFAARREHLDKVIIPALREGTWVISDRFTDASFAYQGGGRGLDEAKLSILEQWVQQDLQPDLTLLFDVTLEVSRQRLSSNATLDRFEQEKQDFFQRVRDAYLKRAAQFPDRIRVIDSGRTLNEIQVDLEGIISSL
ncbi:MAG: dTMP kinase [Betaproteobacteria bacterium CG2_30_59_46]|nr:MAG: dTMP kinase [Betaproteobacteria bacterium CG2_30_59_46]PIQ12925.1 MAG: dTMP kinase [Hydrogenophilales bacterium CG18_big_fil_WC_8_21_14_2_50_58_12]PIX99484.1 MAG: dTMP kinase [Hydrogenophilales bacterium CG_4_10_14_3_um_filter_58_23]PJB08062.1 MAG: dTMP kinase [Hydrogenophilales bacterium CG_4_9_14_3_um_filter_59_35]